MNLRIIIPLFIVAGLVAWNLGSSPFVQAPSKGKHMNRLGQEKSPYLLQHKDNPVHWFSWGPEAIQAAKREDKPIFLSIGYSTCYWCHVMEKDSFEREEVADFLNEHFISIKVDREERPDVDRIYMDAVVAMRGRGGWPISVFLTPDLKPFFGGTYFPRQDFLKILNNLQMAWQEKRSQITQSSERLTDFLEGTDSTTRTAPVDLSLLKEAFAGFQESFDKEWGGFGRAPKFPRSMGFSVLLRIHRRTGNHQALKMATQTLDKMAAGGLYDHLGGGFHRYSTDEFWHVPHFEKMLYDNALLAWTYLEAFQVTERESYAAIARETLDYVLRDMTHPEGSFYSAEDAGEVKREGEYYVWSEQELNDHLLPKELEALKNVFAISSKGNFENGHNILYLKQDKTGQDKKGPLVTEAMKKLFEARSKRPRPHLDDKILTAWNGLMIAALAKGAQVLGESKYRAAAIRAARFIQKRLYQDGKLKRRFREGESRYAGNINDYAFLIHGLLTLYETDFDPNWLDWARKLQKTQETLFWDSQKGGYYFHVADDPTLLVRTKEVDDGALPSGNAIAALNLLRLYNLTFETPYKESAETLLTFLAPHVKRYPPGYAQALSAIDFYLDRSKEIAVIGLATDPKRKEVQDYLFHSFLPNKVVAISEPIPKKDAPLPLLEGKPMQEGQTTIYVCEENICKQPTTDLDQAKRLISDFEKYSL